MADPGPQMQEIIASFSSDIFPFDVKSSKR